MQDRIAWVFGASGKLGLNLVNCLLEKNYHVVAFVHQNLSIEFNDKYGVRHSNVSVCSVDLIDSNKILDKVNAIAREFGEPFSIFFAARGIVVPDSQLINNIPILKILEDYQISVLSPVIIANYSIINYQRLKSVIFVSSQYATLAQDSGLYSSPENSLSSLYCAHKAAILSAGRNLAAQAASKGVHVNSILLGGLVESTDEALRDRIELRLPSKKMLTSLQAASAIVQLSEVSLQGLIGSNIVLDLGWSIT